MFLNAKFMYVQTLLALCPVLVWVGMMGGASYVNVLHGILELKTLNKQERESAMSLSLFFNDFGILSASAFSLILANTIFDPKKF